MNGTFPRSFVQEQIDALDASYWRAVNVVRRLESESEIAVALDEERTVDRVFRGLEDIRKVLATGIPSVDLASEATEAVRTLVDTVEVRIEDGKYILTTTGAAEFVAVEP